MLVHRLTNYADRIGGERLTDSRTEDPHHLLERPASRNRRGNSRAFEHARDLCEHIVAITPDAPSSWYRPPPILRAHHPLQRDRDLVDVLHEVSIVTHRPEVPTPAGIQAGPRIEQSLGLINERADVVIVTPPHQPPGGTP